MPAPVASYVLAVISAVCNATFFCPNRLESVKAANLHPIIYNWYTTIGVFVFSWIVALFNPMIGLPVFVFTKAGFVAGSTFTFALLFSCLALPLLGLGMAMGIWCGAATLVSFAWGTVGPPLIARPMADVPLSIAGIGAITLGILGIIYCTELGTALFAKLYGGEWAKINTTAESSSGPEGSLGSRALGVIYALLVGCFGGSMLAPLAFVPPEFSGIKGIGFVPSFGTGSVITGTLIVIIFWIYKGEAPKWEVERTLWAGLVSGNVWNFGNLCQVIAQSYYGLPYAIAYPIFQASLVASGLLGIYVFNEIRGNAAICFFFLSAIIVVVGAGLLAVYGPQQG